MAAKIDKDALKKNQFWIGLGAFAVLWLIGLVMVLFAGDDKAKADYEGAKKKIETAKSQGPKTEKFLEPWKAYGEKFRAQKDKVWKKAWDEQSVMYTWPDGMPVVPLYPEDAFGANITTDANNRGKYRTDLYKEQFEGLDTYVLPATFNGGFDTVFPKQLWDRSNPPTREEIWLAQEDFWVRREMLVTIRAAIDAVATFREIPLKSAEAKKDLPKGVVSRRLFRNANFELDLMFEPSKERRGLVISEQSTIKNINEAQKTLNLANPRTGKGLPFRLQQGRAIYELRIAGEPLPYDKKAEIKRQYRVDPVDLNKPFQIEQLLEWENSPIRRIDALSLAHHSHRTATFELKLNEELKKLDPAPEDSADAQGGTAGPGADASSGPPGGGAIGMPTPGAGSGKGLPAMGEGPGGIAGPGGPGGGVPVEATRINQIPRKRYLSLTPQCKHLPIAMRLIVDQSHIHDVLAAVANSRLRIQITQVTLSHARDVQRPTQLGELEPGTAGPGTPGDAGSGRPLRPGMGTGIRPPMYSPGRGEEGGGAMVRGPGMPLPPGGGMRFPGGPVGPGRFGPGAGGEEDMGFGRTGEGANQFQDRTPLVEMCIYGIAALYERFPPNPNKKTDTTDGASGASGTTPAASKP